MHTYLMSVLMPVPCIPTTVPLGSAFHLAGVDIL